MRARPILAAGLLALLGLLPGMAAAQGDPSFNLLNRSGQTIREIYVSAVTDTNWGRDLLGQDVLADGRAFAVRIAPSAGCRHDVRVVYADGRPEERRDVNTCTITQMAFGTAPAPQALNPSFNLVNHGRQPVREVYVSSVRENDWGSQRLRQPMQPGEHLQLRLPSGDCVNDVLVVWSDGRRDERRRVDTCQVTNIVVQ
jgi:hypothetical protein